MGRYVRLRQQGGCYFFTLVTYRRCPVFASQENIDRLRAAFMAVERRRPFHVDAIVILPDHLHCIWRLPEGDADYASRWAQIKRRFTMSLDAGQRRDYSRSSRRERAVWQRRYWEHLIRDEEDWRRHMDYIHYNPVKHGYVSQVREWPYSSFDVCVGKGWYEPDWGEHVPASVLKMDIE